MAFEMAELKRPQPEMLYSGKNDDQVCFEFHMEKMERSLDSIPGITDSIKLKELEYWFSGMAGTVVRNFAVGEDDIERLAMAKNKLREHFNDRQKSTKESLEKLMEGEPIAKDIFYDILGFIIDFGSKYVMAKRMGEAAGQQPEKQPVSLKSTYINLMQAKLPHLIEKWIREFRVPQREQTFDAFEEFVLRVARMDEEISSMTL
jgi:hypothetical protein